MEAFRKKLERRVKLYALVGALFSIMIIVSVRVFKNANDYSQGTALGFCCGSCGVYLFMLLKNAAVLRDEEKLRRLYIETTDERNIAIAKETMSTSYTVSMLVLVAVCVISGFFSEVVSLTLGAVIIVLAVVRLLVGIYYKRKM